MIKEKTALRKKYGKIRAEVTDKELRDAKISTAVLESGLYKSCDTLLCFVGTGNEISTEAIIQKALLDGKRVAVPRCIDKVGNMTFHYIESLSELRCGMYGIPEPPESNEKFDVSDNALCILPGLCFDKSGERLGYGKGYYDRFLDSFCGTTAGICYEDCICDCVPSEDTDKKVNYIITDERIYKI